MKICTKHNFGYADYLRDCPICIGEKMGGKPVNIRNAGNKVKRDAVERKPRVKRVVNSVPIKRAKKEPIKIPRAKINRTKEKSTPRVIRKTPKIIRGEGKLFEL